MKRWIHVIAVVEKYKAAAHYRLQVAVSHQENYWSWFLVANMLIKESWARTESDWCLGMCHCFESASCRRTSWKWQCQVRRKEVKENEIEQLPNLFPQTMCYTSCTLGSIFITHHISLTLWFQSNKNSHSLLQIVIFHSSLWSLRRESIYQPCL